MSHPEKNPGMGALAIIGAVTIFLFVINLPSDKVEMYPLPPDPEVGRGTIGGKYRSWKYGKEREFLLTWHPSGQWVFTWAGDGDKFEWSPRLPSFLEPRSEDDFNVHEDYKAPYASPW